MLTRYRGISLLEHHLSVVREATGRLEKLAAVSCCASLVREDVIRRSGAMGQLGFFDAEKRLAALSEKGDPLEAIAALVPWELGMAADRLRRRAMARAEDGPGMYRLGASSL